ncbi:hypothetical protein JANAI62_18700 [Jannaschia pagri]|uniref:Ca2+-binding protein, RTX toxin-related n=1 Tax=Jannaschia pagri TaxID=2829797 RepID=A0ABQ4NMB3_9RHOB|nr:MULTISPECIES: calcium-binding protein [unclassified Jannaschia]GIT91413.1 hypothetical protein JANAI61_18710 [Jannaschia sp. AI_61]GIT95247.1 hypothetical protein JANAI62_18700 [Jannaschia sp. AI_62]
MFNVDTSNQVDLNHRSMFQLGSDRVVEIISGPFNQLNVAVWDGAGNQLTTEAELVGPDQPRMGYTPWHVRDDGEGAFSIFVEGRSGTTTNLLLVSFDADGQQTNVGSYERLAFDKFRANDAIDVGDGRVLAVVDVGDRVESKLYGRDGTILNEDLWNSGAGSQNARGGDVNFAMTRSGDTAFVFYIADGAHGLQAELYLTRTQLNGEPVVESAPEVALAVDTFQVGSVRDSTRMLDAITLDDGRVVLVTAVIKNVNNDGSPVDRDLKKDIFLWMFNPDGSVFLPETKINEFELGTQQEVLAFPVDTGGFIVLYHNIAPQPSFFFPDRPLDPFEGPEDRVIMRLYDADGNAVGDSEAPLGAFQFGENSLILPDGTGYIADTTGVFTLTTDLPVVAPRVEGDDDPNTLTGGDEAELIFGLGGDDILNGGLGDDTIDGGAGVDTWVASGPNGVQVNLGTGLATDGLGGTDNLLLIENVRGGDGDDYIIGDDNDNLLEGMGGNDTLEDAGGIDVLDGGDGIDTYQAAGDQGVVASLLTNTSTNLAGDRKTLISIESLRGTEFFDRLQAAGGEVGTLLEGMGGNDRLNGGNGNDTLDGGAGRDGMDGGSGDDTFIVDNERDSITERPNDGFDTIIGLGNVRVSGEIERVQLQGNGNFRVDGNSFGQEIVGNAGSNILIGGGGEDTLTGGGGQDFFAFLTSDRGGPVTITDFGGRDQLAIDDQFFGLGDGGVDPRAVTAQLASTALALGTFSYDRRTGELFIDSDGRRGAEAPELIAVLQGGGALTADDVLLF